MVQLAQVDQVKAINLARRYTNEAEPDLLRELNNPKGSCDCSFTIASSHDSPRLPCPLSYESQQSRASTVSHMRDSREKIQVTR